MRKSERLEQRHHHLKPTLGEQQSITGFLQNANATENTTQKVGSSESSKGTMDTGISDPTWVPTPLPADHPIHRLEEAIEAYAGSLKGSPILLSRHAWQRTVDIATSDGKRPQASIKSTQSMLRAIKEGFVWTMDVNHQRLIVKRIGGSASYGFKYHYWAGREEGFLGPIAYTHVPKTSFSKKDKSSKIGAKSSAEASTECENPSVTSRTSARVGEKRHSSELADSDSAESSWSVNQMNKHSRRKLLPTPQESVIPMTTGASIGAQAAKVPSYTADPVNIPGLASPFENVTDRITNSINSLGQPLGRVFPATPPNTTSPSTSSTRKQTPELTPVTPKKRSNFSQENTVFRLFLDNAYIGRRIPFSSCRSMSDFFARITDACGLAQDQIVGATVIINSEEG